MEVRVETYSELQQYVRAFKDGTFQVLFVIGEHGQSKTTIVEKVLPPSKTDKGTQWIDGGDVSAFELYLRLHRSIDQTFILDDCDQFYTDRTIIRLMKVLCQTKEVKRVGWHKHNSWMEKEGIPKEFLTRTRVVIIANRSHEISKHVASLEDRGLMVHFQPTVSEVLKLGRGFIKDREVIRYVEDHARYIETLSLRSMKTAAEMKAAGLSRWKQALRESLKIDRLLDVEELLADRSFLTDAERIVQFGGPASTFYALKKRLADLDQPRIRIAPDPPKKSGRTAS